MMSMVKVPQEVRQARSVAAKKKKGAAWLAELHAPSATALHAPAALRAHSAQGRRCIHMRRRVHSISYLSGEASMRVVAKD